jgi:hypothetical protein
LRREKKMVEGNKGDKKARGEMCLEQKRQGDREERQGKNKPVFQTQSPSCLLP